MTRKKKFHHATGVIGIARDYARDAHQGERLKFVDGPYFWHVKSVSERMHSKDEVIVAFLHDAIESKVKKALGKKPDPEAEERLIALELETLALHFKKFSYDIDHLLGDINVLTRRVTDKDDSDELNNNKKYKAYIGRIIAHAQKTGSRIAPKVKKADLKDNSDPARNPKVGGQTLKDRMRIARYEKAASAIVAAFPCKTFPDMVLQDNSRRPHEKRMDAAHRNHKPMRPQDRHNRNKRIRSLKFGGDDFDLG
jgi:hypothetical protein